MWRRFRRATRGPRNAVLARGIDGIARLLGALPAPLALGVGRMLGAAAHALLGTPRRLALTHVALAFPELPIDERQRLVRATFRHAGQSFVELALWPKLRQRPGYVTFEGLDVADALLAAGRGAIAVTGHTGNWELLAAALAGRGYHLSVVARRVNDARFDALVGRFRRMAGVEVLVRDAPNFLGTVRAALARGRVVALLIDQDTRGAGVFVSFFGRPAHTPPGAALLALRARVPVLTAFIERRPAGGHLVRVAAVEVGEGAGRSRVTDLTARLTAAIEAQIRRVPTEWVWWHERWRRQPETASSPLHVGDRVVPVSRR